MYNQPLEILPFWDLPFSPSDTYFTRKSRLVTLGQLSIHDSIGMLEQVFGNQLSFLTKPAWIQEETLDLTTSSAAVELHLRTISIYSISIYYTLLKREDDYIPRNSSLECTLLCRLVSPTTTLPQNRLLVSILLTCHHRRNSAHPHLNFRSRTQHRRLGAPSTPSSLRYLTKYKISDASNANS